MAGREAPALPPWRNDYLVDYHALEERKAPLIPGRPAGDLEELTDG